MIHLGGSCCYFCGVQERTSALESDFFELSVQVCDEHGEALSGLLLVLSQRSRAPSPDELEPDLDRAGEYRAHAEKFSEDARAAFADLLGVSSSDRVLELFVASVVFAAEANTMARLLELGKA